MTKDQQIKHLKATIGGLVRALRWADAEAIREWRARTALEKKFSAQLEAEALAEVQKMAYRAGAVIVSTDLERLQ